MWQKGNKHTSVTAMRRKKRSRKGAEHNGDDVPNEIGHQRGPTLPFGIRIEPNKLMYRAPRAAQVVGRDIKPKLCKSKTVSCLCAYAKCLTLNWLILWPLSLLTYELTSIAIMPDLRYPCGRCRRRGRATLSIIQLQLDGISNWSESRWLLSHSPSLSCSFSLPFTTTCALAWIIWTNSQWQALNCLNCCRLSGRVYGSDFVA